MFWGGENSTSDPVVVEMTHEIAHAQEMKITDFPEICQLKLREIDTDGSGTLSGSELVTMVDMFAESKKTQKKLMYVIGGLLGLLVVALVAIGLITSFVVEGAKETKTDSSGVTLVAGSNTVAAGGSAQSQSTIFSAASYTYDQLNSVKNLQLIDGNDVLMYQPVEWKSTSTYVEFTTARGYVIKVTDAQVLTATDPNGAVFITSTPSMEMAMRRRRLLEVSEAGEQFELKGYFSALQTSGSFTMMQAGGF